MPDTPNISDAEWDVIKVIWDGGPQTAGQIVEALEGQKHWKPRTIKTLLSRLVKKGAVKAIVEDKRYLYRAAITRQLRGVSAFAACIAAATADRRRRGQASQDGAVRRDG